MSHDTKTYRWGRLQHFLPRVGIHSYKVLLSFECNDGHMARLVLLKSLPKSMKVIAWSGGGQLRLKLLAGL